MKRNICRIFVLLSLAAVAAAGCFSYERKYIKDIEVYKPPEPPAHPMLWAAGPEGSHEQLLARSLTDTPAFKNSLGIDVLATEGSLASLEQIAAGKALLATVRADHAALAQQGNNQQIRNDATRAICALQPMVGHILIKKQKSPGGVKGLPEGSTILTDALWEGGSVIARQILRACGRNPDRFNYSESGPKKALEELKLSQVSAAIVTTAFGSAEIDQILQEGLVDIVSFPPEFIGGYLENRPYYLPFNIPENTYANQKRLTHSVMVKNILVVRVDAPPDLVLKICAELFPALHACRLKQKLLPRLSHALEGIPMPIHQGARNYYNSRCELYTGDPLSTYYDVGRALGKFINGSFGPEILARKSSGAMENISAIENMRSQLALVQSDMAYKALAGSSDAVPPAPSLRAVACLSPERVHFVVTKKSGIISLDGIAGKRINLGELGSGTMLNAVEVLQAAGIYKKLKKENLFFHGHLKLLQALQANKIDCFFTVSTDPSEFLTNLLATGRYRILSLPKHLIDKLAADYPYFTTATIPGGFYPKQHNQISTISTVMLLVTHKDCSSELVDRIISLLGEKARELPLQHPLLYYVNEQRLWTRSAVPFHEAVAPAVAQHGWPIKTPALPEHALMRNQAQEAPEGDTRTEIPQEIRDRLYPPISLQAEDDTSDLGGNGEDKEKRFMSLQETTLVALKRNLAIAIGARNPLLKQLDIAIQKAEFYPTLAAGVRQQVHDQESILRSKTQTLSAAISEKLPTGTQVKIGADWVTWDDTKSKYTHAGSAFFEMSQPLLEGMGLEINLSDYRLAREDAEISIESFRDTLIGTLSTVRSQYYELLRTFDTLLIEQQTLELARAQNERTAALAMIGKVPEGELTIAKAQYASRQDNVILARKNYRDQEDALLQLLRAQFLYSVEPTLRLPLGKKIFAPVYKFDTNEMVTAFQKRPDVRNTLAAIEKAYINERVAKNALLPNLDLNMRLYNTANTFRHEEDVLHDFRDFNDVMFSLGLGLTLPLPNTADRSSYIKAQIAREQTLLSLEQVRETVQREVREAVRSVQSAEQRIPITKNALNEAEKQIAEQLLKFNNGETDNFNVFRAITDFADARLAELNALVDYYQAVVDLHKTLGITDEKLNISIYDTLKSSPHFNNAFTENEKTGLQETK
ncbi:TAXI family TRAP transporter solute-binding subunit [Thermodesulfobacteriota bacterium]